MLHAVTAAGLLYLSRKLSGTEPRSLWPTDRHSTTDASTCSQRVLPRSLCVQPNRGQRRLTQLSDHRGIVISRQGIAQTFA